MADKEIVYVDTSAFLAVLSRNDINHAEAAEIWRHLLRTDCRLVCSSYVLIETCSLLQGRLGVAALRRFSEDAYPMLDVMWVSKEVHEAGLDAVLSAGRRELSLTDCVSFALMRRLGMRDAFAFDRHFAEQGFRVLQQ